MSNISPGYSSFLAVDDPSETNDGNSPLLPQRQTVVVASSHTIESGATFFCDRDVPNDEEGPLLPHQQRHTELSSHPIEPGNRITRACVCGTILTCCFYLSVLAVITPYASKYYVTHTTTYIHQKQRAKRRWIQFGGDLNGQVSGSSSRRIGENFGKSVSMSSDGVFLAIGAPLYGSETEDGVGRVKVFATTSTNARWRQLGDDVTGKTAHGNFGESVSLSSEGLTLAAVSLDRESHPDVFTLDGSTGLWREPRQDDAPQEEQDPSSLFDGTSVSLSSDGKSMVVGVPDKNYARAYRERNGRWYPLGDRVYGDENEKCGKNGLGKYVSLDASGTKFAVSAPLWDCTSHVVRVFRLLATNRYVQAGKDIGPDFESGANSVSLSPDGRRVTVAFDCCVVVFELRSNEIWEALGRPIETVDELGVVGSVSLSEDGGILAVGSKDNNIVRVYEYTDGEWVQLGQDLTGDGGQFGYSVSLSSDGTTLAVGAPCSDKSDNGNYEGRVQTFTLEKGY